MNIDDVDVGGAPKWNRRRFQFRGGLPVSPLSHTLARRLHEFNLTAVREYECKFLLAPVPDLAVEGQQMPPGAGPQSRALSQLQVWPFAKRALYFCCVSKGRN